MLENIKQIKSTKLVIVVAVIITGLVGAAAYFAFVDDDSSRNNSQTESKLETANQNIDMNPATEEDKENTEKHKEDILKQNNEEPSVTEDGRRKVNPVVTYAGQQGQTVTINTFVSGVIENGGNCTAVFTNGIEELTKTTSAFADASNTNCAPFFVEATEFSAAGEWEVTVRYESPTATGTSQAKLFTIN